jgi:hypothetical protein
VARFTRHNPYGDASHPLRIGHTELAAGEADEAGWPRFGVRNGISGGR